MGTTTGCETDGEAERKAPDDLEQRERRLAEERARILDEIANDPDPGRVDVGRA